MPTPYYRYSDSEVVYHNGSDAIMGPADPSPEWAAYQAWAANHTPDVRERPITPTPAPLLQSPDGTVWQLAVDNSGAVQMGPMT